MTQGWTYLLSISVDTRAVPNPLDSRRLEIYLHLGEGERLPLGVFVATPEEAERVLVVRLGNLLRGSA